MNNTVQPTADPKPSITLRRELGVPGATMMGLGSIVGTGIFVSIGVGAGVAGPAVIIAIVIAAFVATCNALSSAQLAASHPVSGGTYEYGYKYLTPAMGFTAGWMFLCAKSASAATAALGFAGYLLHLVQIDTRWLTPVALATVTGMTLLVLTGIKRSSLANIVIVSITLFTLALFVAMGAGSLDRYRLENLQPLWPTVATDSWGWTQHLLHATALMFVAYTGYGRIATMGEEVHHPGKTIPRAIITTLVVSAVLYTLVAVVAIATVGGAKLGDVTQTTGAPLEFVATQFTQPWVSKVVAIGAMTAMLGVLLNLVLGLSRVALAMGRRSDLPAGLSRVNQAGSPNAAVIFVGVIIFVLASLGSIKTAWTFSAFTVLVYYALTNLAALRLPAEHRLYSRFFPWMGLFACAFLAFWVEWPIWLAGLGLIAVGLVWHGVRRRMSGGRLSA